MVELDARAAELLKQAQEAASDNAEADKPARPHVHVDPAMRFGRPHMRGVSTEVIVGTIAAGDDEQTVCDEYGLTRHELLVAVWFEGTHGGRRNRKLFGAWAEKAYPVLSGFDKTRSVDEIELPEVDGG